MDYRLELFLEHPWAWFSDQQPFVQFIVGAGVLMLFMMACMIFIITDSDEWHPEESEYPTYRLAAGLLLEFGLIIYFWPEIHHFFRWWFPYANFFLQLGSLVLICFCLIMIGHFVECGLLRGGVGKKIHPCIWGGLQREHGFLWGTALLLFMLTILYAYIYILVWIVGALVFLWHKIF